MELTPLGEFWLFANEAIAACSAKHHSLAKISLKESEKQQLQFGDSAYTYK
ncbi:hypothetical protein [Nostoc sp.]|uniref:hypothetical protein n=1 Tax=Nostoc sp. TaxID=1180 RepID=UPI002FF63238